MTGNWAASALAWWQEAGVDTILDEAPRDWLNPTARTAAAALPAAEAPSEPIPETLEAFRAWLTGSGDFPGASPYAPRIAPSGPADADLMVMIDMPSLEDVGAGTLLSGEPGQLFDRMIAAIGRSRETLYLASLVPFRTPTGSLAPATTAQVARIARQHVGLVGPRALLLFGDACAKALLGTGATAARGKWHELETPAGKIRTLATIRPEKLIGQPGLKKHAWEDLKMLKEGLEP